jgi:hypothetical protein
MPFKESCWILRAIVRACKKVRKKRKKRKKGLAGTEFDQQCAGKCA